MSPPRTERPGRRTPAALLLAASLLAAPGASIVYVMPTDEAMIRQSPIIVFGEVVASAAGGGRPVFTNHTLRVEETLKGAVSGNTITVRQHGGVLGDLATIVPGSPMLAEGDRVLLFIGRRGSFYRPVQSGLGVFFETSSDGRTLLLRDRRYRPEAAAPRDSATGDRQATGPRDAARFRRWIADRAAGVARPADYFAPNAPETPRAVSSPFRLIEANQHCIAPGTAVRWRNFDRRTSLAFVAHDSQPGGDRASAVLAALRAWSEIPGSAVRLVSGGAPSGEFSFRLNGRNSIGFEDPRDDIQGSFVTSGTVAMAHLNYRCGKTAAPHTIPGTSTAAYEIYEVNIVTQDGLEQYVSSSEPSPLSANLAEVVAHEVGHALGIWHSLHDSAIMWHQVLLNGRGAALHHDDRAAAIHLYPPVADPPPPGPGGGGGGGPPPEPPPEPPPPPPPAAPPTASFAVDVPCPDGLCRARTGQEISFTDTSSGTVERRSWNFDGAAGRPPVRATARHAWSSPGFYGVTLTVGGAGSESRASRRFLVEAAEPAGSCVADGETLCLRDSRYQVRVAWRSPEGDFSPARVARTGTNDSGLFWFRDRTNWELLIKVLDACGINGAVWVFGASATDLGLDITVTDTASNEVRSYRTNAGEAAPAISDQMAFREACKP